MARSRRKRKVVTFEEPSLSEVLREPITKQLIKSYKLKQREVKELLHETADRIQPRELETCCE